MKKLYCVIYGKYRKSEKPKISYICEETLLAVSAKIKMKNISRRKIIWDIKLKIYNYLKNMVEENISQEFWLKNIDETRNYFLEEIQQNEMISK